MQDGPQDPTRDPTEQTTRTAHGASDQQERIGSYRILERVGTGGMGEVYRAEQTDPIRRTVALKIIKRGMDTKEVITRFEVERQALALMDHPNIAKVFDAGSTPSGRPYFVMEYVRGVPITTYCDEHKLSMPERLGLFIQLCEGVQHAHQKAIIHRDLKPSNVLVTVQDHKPVPKIIDFGVAKATAQKLTEKTMYTALGEMIGTPEYMSPEQAALTGEDVDTRTDVYALGVILYELLAGVLPFEPTELRKAGFEGIIRMIREQDPARPSRKVGTLGERRTLVAQARRSPPGKLASRLRGDLDWVTMRALEKDRARRYGSPGELAADIRRHLRNEPVLAGPPKAAYRMRKFVRRHRVGVGAVLAAAGMLVVFAVTMTVQARRIALERDKAKKVSEFLSMVFSDIDPIRADGQSITLKEILDRGARRVAELREQPSVQADLMMTLGDVYGNLGMLERGQHLLEEALHLRLQLYGEQHMSVGIALSSLGECVRNSGDLARSDSLFTKALHIFERAPDHQVYVETLHELAVLRRLQERFSDAESLYVRVLQIRRSQSGLSGNDVGKVISDLAVLHFYAGQMEEAEARCREALKVYESAVPVNYLLVGESLSNLGAILKARSKYRESVEVLTRAGEIQRKHLGSSHWHLARTLLILGKTYVQLERYEDALLALQEAHTIIESLGSEHPVGKDVLETLTTCVHAYEKVLLANGRKAEADSLVERFHDVLHWDDP